MALFLAITANCHTLIGQHFFEDQRDGNTYEVVTIEEMSWLKENLRFKTDGSSSIQFDGTEGEQCGEYYSLADATKACPVGWTLPTEKQINSLIKLQKKRVLSITDSLDIRLCGRLDNHKTARQGEQATFWLNAAIMNGNIAHWHLHKNEHHVHTHNVINANRFFAVRCVKKRSK